LPEPAGKPKKTSNLRQTLTSILSAIALLVIGMAVFADLFADRAVKAGIEAATSEALKVDVDVNDVDLALTKGKLVLRNLVMGNPPGYKHEQMLKLDRARVYVDTGSLLTDEIRIEDIKIEGIDITLEQRGLSNNVQDVLDSIEQRETAGGKKLHIETIRIHGVKVAVKAGAGDNRIDLMTMELDPIMISDVGSDKKLDMAGLSGLIFVAIAEAIVEQGVGQLPGEVLGALSSAIGKTLDDIGKEILQGGKTITEGLGGLLNPGKDAK